MRRIIFFIIFVISCFGSYALGSFEIEKSKTDVQSKTEQQFTKELMISTRGYIDDIELSGAEKWYAIYVDKTKLFIAPAKLVMGDMGSIGTQVHGGAEASFFGISELINGPQTGKAAKSVSTKCEKKDRTSTAIQGPDRAMIPAGTEFCVEETQKFSLDGKEIKIEKTYVDSPGYNVYALKMIWNGQSAELIQERRPAVLMLGDLGDDGSFEMILTYTSTKGELPGNTHNRIRLVKIENGQVRILYDGKDTGEY